MLQTLMLDYDEPWTQKTICERLARCRVPLRHLNFKVRDVKAWRSSGGRGYHVELTSELGYLQYGYSETLVAIQAALGSDPVRELFNLERVRNYHVWPKTSWNRLWTQKGRRKRKPCPVLEKKIKELMK
jgi:hypothetical protein